MPARDFAKVDCTTVKGMGCFKNWSPRLGIVYDLFSNHQTALKAGFGKYTTPIVTSILNNFNPMFLTTVNIPWNDANRNGIPDLFESGMFGAMTQPPSAPAPTPAYQEPRPASRTMCSSPIPPSYC